MRCRQWEEVRVDAGTVLCAGHVWAQLTRRGAVHRVCEYA